MKDRKGLEERIRGTVIGSERKKKKVPIRPCGGINTRTVGWSGEAPAEAVGSFEKQLSAFLGELAYWKG